VGTVTEVVGRAGSGKTQLALSSVVVAAALSQGAIYLDTEQKLSLSRLQEIAAQRYTMSTTSTNHPKNALLGDDSNLHYAPPDHVLQNMTVHTPSTLHDVHTVLVSLEEEILERNETNQFPVRLVVLDSIAAPARRDAAVAAHERAARVLHCAQALKRLAHQFQLAVLVINQVSGNWNDSSTINNNTINNNNTEPSTRAALGTAWHHCVTTRVVLDYDDHHSRRATLVKSAVAPTGKPWDFGITPAGIE
jgi:RAD51-like protein 1